jgi:hypothetical protein
MLKPVRIISSLIQLVLLILIGLAEARFAYSQGFGTIVGTVTDSTGAVVPSAKVKVTDQATGAVRETATNEQGYYVVPSLRPSTYDISVRFPGFAESVQKGVVLQADQSLTLNVALAVEQATQSLEVQAAALQVNTTTGANSEVVDRQRVEELPLNGRNAAALLTIVAGAIPSPANDVDQGNTKTFPTVVAVSTNGARQDQVNFRLDGVTNTDIYTNVNQPFPFPDALQEFSVQTANYDARYGGMAGGVVNVITKSGSNDFHGSGFEFVRNEVFNARNFFSTFRDHLKRNQFGGTLGGPFEIPGIYNGRNRDLFFFGYQATLIRNVSGTSNAFVPTVGNAAGDFSNLLNASNPSNPFGAAIQILDPKTGQPFSGNLIPADRLDPAAVKFMKYLPLAPNGMSSRVFWSQPLAQNFYEFMPRWDHIFSERDHLTARYFQDLFENQAYLDPRNYLNSAAYAKIRAQNAMVSETHLFTPTVLNEVRLAFSREYADRGPASGSISLADLGVNIFQPSTKIIEGINVAGYFNVSQTDPAQFVRNQYALSDDVSWVTGKHSIGFGFHALRAQGILRNTFHLPGSFTFTSDGTNNALASFLLGYVRSFQQGYGEWKDTLVNTYSLYVQDNYHVSRRWTLNLGLRWDPFIPWRETKNRTELFSLSNYYAGIRSRVYTNAPPGLLFPGDPGVPDAGLNPNYRYFGPRFGFAGDVFGDGNTSVRGGLGMFYDSLPPNTMSNRMVDLTPFSPQINLTQPQGTFSNPYLGITNPFPGQWPPPKDAPFPPPVLAVTYDTANNFKGIAPVMYTWNVTLERQLPGGWLARAGYVGSHGSHQMESIELNPSVYIPGSNLGADARRILPGYSNITQVSYDINSNFHSLQLTAQKRSQKGLSVLANYTWSKSIDDLPATQAISGPAVGLSSPIPFYLPGRHQFDRGPSDYDHRQYFVVSYLYELPKLASSSPFVRAVAGGWQLTGIISAMTGAPVTLLAGQDQSRTANNADRAYYNGGPVYGPGACGASIRCVSYLVKSSFSLPALGTYGNIGKGSVYGPGSFGWNAGLFKEFPLRGENVRAQFRAEFFNLTNRANFNNPNTAVNSGGFGTITGAQDPRIGQLGLKLLF